MTDNVATHRHHFMRLVSSWENPDTGEYACLISGPGKRAYYTDYYSRFGEEARPACTAWYVHEHITALRRRGFLKVAAPAPFCQ